MSELIKDLAKFWPINDPVDVIGLVTVFYLIYRALALIINNGNGIKVFGVTLFARKVDRRKEHCTMYEQHSELFAQMAESIKQLADSQIKMVARFEHMELLNEGQVGQLSSVAEGTEFMIGILIAKDKLNGNLQEIRDRLIAARGAKEALDKQANK